MMIRNAEIQDAARIKEIHTDSVRTLCSPFYTPDQISVWTGGDQDGMGRVIENSPCCIVMETDGEITGFASLRPNFSIWHLYIDPAYIKQGIGSALLKELEEFLRAAEHKTITLEATLNAVPFYKRHGYEEGERSCVSMAEQEIEIIKMKKRL